MLRSFALASVSCLALSLLASAPASALTMKECSVKYQEAKTANKLKGMKWNDFRKAECGDDDASDADAASAVSEPAPAAAPAPAPAAAAAAKPAATAKPTVASAPATAAAGKVKPAVFPKAVNTKYSDEAAGKARLHTCADQYNANKAANANGNLKWIEKGGGYWSQCNAKLKS